MLLIKPVGISLHGNRVSITAELLVDSGEDTPHLKVNGPLGIRPFPACGSIFYITVMEEILRRKNIGALTRGRCLTIRGKLHEEVVVVGALLRACEEIIEEPLRVLIIVPEYAEIVVHLIPPSAAGIPPHCLRYLLGNPAHAGRRRNGARDRQFRVPRSPPRRADSML